MFPSKGVAVAFSVLISSARPKLITVDSEEVEFSYEEESGLVTIDLSVLEKELYQWNISIDL